MPNMYWPNLKPIPLQHHLKALTAIRRHIGCGSTLLAPECSESTIEQGVIPSTYRLYIITISLCLFSSFLAAIHCSLPPSLLRVLGQNPVPVVLGHPAASPAGGESVRGKAPSTYLPASELCLVGKGAQWSRGINSPCHFYLSQHDCRCWSYKYCSGERIHPWD